MSDSSLIESKLNNTKCYSKDDLSLTTKKSSNELSREDTIKELKAFSTKIEIKDVTDHNAMAATKSDLLKIKTESAKESQIPIKNDDTQNQNQPKTSRFKSFISGLLAPSRVVGNLFFKSEVEVIPKETKENKVSFSTGVVPGLALGTAFVGALAVGYGTAAAAIAVGCTTLAALFIAGCVLYVAANIAAGVFGLLAVL